MIDKSKIKNVAIYLRKSRVEEEDKDIINHRLLLEQIAKERGWITTIYKEDGDATSQDLDIRVEMTKLRYDLSKYDGVMVVEQARLSRTMTDSETLLKEFKIAQTYLIIQGNILDLNESHDKRIYEFNSFIGSMEYTEIVARLNLGKKMGLERGHWVYGPAPYGYTYNKKTKILNINEVERDVYRLVMSKYLDDEWPTNKIAFYINKLYSETEDKKYRTRYGKAWNKDSILRLLKSEVYLGHIVYGKQVGSLHKKKKGKNAKPFKKIPESDWKKKLNCHLPLKTPEEHQAVLFRIENSVYKNLQVKSVKTRRVHALSGLVVCKQCGYVLSITYKERDDKFFIRKCQHRTELGVKCTNSSISYEVLLNDVIEDIIDKRNEIEHIVESNEHMEKIEKNKAKELKKVNAEIAILEKKRDTIYTSYEMGIYTVDEFNERRAGLVEKISSLKLKVPVLTFNSLELKESLRKRRIERYQYIIDNWDIEDVGGNLVMDDVERNDRLMSIIDKIEFYRECKGTRGREYSYNIIWKI